MTMPNQRIDEGERGQLGVAFGRARRAPPQGSSWSLVTTSYASTHSNSNLCSSFRGYCGLVSRRVDHPDAPLRHETNVRDKLL